MRLKNKVYEKYRRICKGSTKRKILNFITMKELSIEEKAKRYDELLVKLQEAKVDNNVCDERYCCVIDDIVPELKESEDERIRKALLNEFIHLQSKGYKFAGLEGEDILAWLEKQGEQKSIDDLTPQEAMDIAVAKCLEQGEQKPADKVEPKFKVGDWLVHKDLVGVICCIAQIHAPHYYLTNDNSFIKFGEEDNYRSWTIQDAKDGDVLSDGNTIFIFKDLLSDCSVMSYCDYDANSGESDAFCPLPMNLTCSKITPATKEQRDQLEKAMADAGYTFDFKKKELKKIAQNPDIEMKTPEESLGIDSETYNKIVDECVYGDDKSTWSEEDEARFESCIKVLQTSDGYDTINVKWLKSLKGRVKPQPKQEWSEEDERLRKEIVDYLECQKKEEPTRKDKINSWISWILKHSFSEWTKEEKEAWNKRLDCIIDILDWAEEKGRISLSDCQDYSIMLKSLRPQTAKQEWSEEDENYKDALIGLINEIKNQPLKRLEDWDGYLNWLKSLKERYTWKPSDEQMDNK